MSAANFTFKTWLTWASSYNMVNLALSVSELVLLYYTGIAARDMVMQIKTHSAFLPLHLPPLNAPLIPLRPPTCWSSFNKLPIATMYVGDLCKRDQPFRHGYEPRWIDTTGTYEFWADCKQSCSSSKENPDKKLCVEYPVRYHIKYLPNPECKPVIISDKENERDGIIKVTYDF